MWRLILLILFPLLAVAAIPPDGVKQTVPGIWTLHIHEPQGDSYSEMIYLISSERLRWVQHSQRGSWIDLERMSMPRIPSRNIIVSTWRIVNTRTNYTLFFSFVFDRDTLTPSQPIHMVQSHDHSQAMISHDNAEEWAVNHLPGVTQTVWMHVPIINDFIPPPPELRRQSAYRRLTIIENRMDDDQDFTEIIEDIERHREDES